MSFKEERDEALAQMGLTDDEIEAGARFMPQVDPDDDRWLMITIRQPRAPGQVVLPPAFGVDAQWRAMKFYLASTTGVLRMLAATLPVALVSNLGLHAIADAIDVVGGVVVQMDENRKNPPPLGDA
jgi:hypothetical protein